MTTDKMLAVYVGCALTHAPKIFKQDSSQLKDMLRDSVHMLDFLGQSSTYTAEEVFTFDINCVRSCDVFVANVTYPSLG